MPRSSFPSPSLPSLITASLITASLITASLITASLLSSCAPAATATPTLSPSPSPLPPTETPTPEPVTLKEVGLSPKLILAFSGAEKYITRAEDGGYLVTAKFRNPETGELEAIDLELLPDTFSLHEDIKNPLAPLTVRAISLTPAPLPQGEGVGVRAEPTLVWTGAEFRLAPSLPAIYEAVNTDNPVFNSEAFAQIPRFTVEDIQSGLAVQSLLVDIQDRLVSSESLSDILYLDPEATRHSWEKYGGNSLLFELQDNGVKTALLKAKGNDMPNSDLRYDNMTMKTLPFGANIEINGENYFAFYIANFDPVNPENPDPNDLANWKFFLDIPTYAGKPVNPSDPNAPINLRDNFKNKKPFTPYIFLYATNPNLDPNDPNTILIPNPSNPDNPTLLDARSPFQSLLAQLLGIEGNDARMADDYMKGLINRGINDLGVLDNLLELPLNGDGYHIRLPADWQTDVVPFEVGVAQ